MIELISSQLQTKNWRKEQDWYINGKSNECEKFQKQIIKAITNNELNKTSFRFNIITYELDKIKNISNINN